MPPLILQIFACLLFGAAFACVVGVVYRIAGNVRPGSTAYTGTSGRRAEMRLRAVRDSILFRLVAPWLRMLGAVVDRMGLEFLKEYIRAPYAKAGYPGGLEDGEVVGLGFLISIGITSFVAFSILVLLSPSWLWMALLGIPMGFLILVSSLRSRGHTREVEILRGLPYLLDLLTLMLRSGTSMRIALSRVVEDYEGHPIGVEFGQVLAEIDLGATRVGAFRKLSNRLKIQDVTALTDAIVQSEELGWPLAETLERLADRLQSQRILKAQSTAGAAGVMVMIPSTFVLASAVLLLFSPWIVQYMRNGINMQ
jgi:tight adherence protein C